MAFFERDTLWIDELSDGVATLVMDVPGRGMNVLTAQLLADLDAALECLAADSGFRLLILRGGKAGQFLAGADIQELSAIQTPAQAEEYSRRGQEVFAKLAALAMPTAALIDGPCLGGGLELALACDYRLVVDQPATQMGLPEVELGLLPGWGGTQRLPRTIGLERALSLILTGKRLGPAEAVAWGLADAVASPDGPPEVLQNPEKVSREGLPLRTWRQKILERTRIGRGLVFRGVLRRLQRRLPDDMPAPVEAFRAVRVGMEESMAAGLAYEREAAGRLATSLACRHLVWLFLAREEQRKKAKPSQDRVIDPIRRVGIIGVGVMGAGIAQLAVLKGNEVVLKEANKAALGLGAMRLLGLLTKAVERGLIAKQELRKISDSVRHTLAWKGFADLDLAIECITEDLDLKRQLFRDLELNSAPSTLLVSNTSALSIAALAEGLQRPERVAGLHFFNPVHKMPLVEVIRTERTKLKVLEELCAWVATLGKTPIIVKDSPGFLVNRVLFPYLHEALVLVGQGMRPALIDETIRRFGLPMGPLELLDHVGLDVAGDIVRALMGQWGSRFPLGGVLEHFQEKGWLGVKTSLGLYHYKRGKTQPHEAAELLLQGEARRLGIAPLEVATPADWMREARERLIALLVNEALACHGEQLVAGADTLDLALVLGAAWPAHRGGPLRYAAELGHGKVLESLTALAQRHGSRFEPCQELRKAAATP